MSCSCAIGYNGDPCTDVNECEIATDNCGDNASCSNTEGSFECTCDQGFTGDGITCTDTDECADTDTCNEATEVCANTVGSFACTCRTGFAGNPCTDINECDLDTDNCDQNASCDNTEGSFECSCNDGFSGDGLACQDINECLNSPCSSLGSLSAFSKINEYVVVKKNLIL